MGFLNEENNYVFLDFYYNRFLNKIAAGLEVGIDQQASLTIGFPLCFLRILFKTDQPEGQVKESENPEKKVNF